MNKVILVGHTTAYGASARVFCRVKITDGKLSITGVVGPKRNGDCVGSCGQISDTLTDAEFVPAVDIDTARLHAVWDRWHLNDMRAGCEHQRSEGWDTRPIDPTKPLRTYGKHFDGQRRDSWNMLTWVTRKEYSEGLMCEPCLTCGYKYGTSWLREELPADVIEFLASLPESPVVPAWV